MSGSDRKPWGSVEKEDWYKEQKIQRSYREIVLPKILELKDSFELIQYGAHSQDPAKYPVYLIKSQKMDNKKKTILITGGVHGYETSGVLGALSFMKNEAKRFEEFFNILCAPCLSPWSFETVNRWNPKAIDPNRNFVDGSIAEECDLFLNALRPFHDQIYAHFDLHETTDTDNTIFRPALEKRDAKTQEWTEIPDGFYVVGDSENPCPEFQRAIIDEVRKFTHIAPPDEKGRIIGEKIEQEGVINYPLKKLSLCAGFSSAKFTTTTEVYPDSPKVNDQNCIDAQVAAVRGGLNFLKEYLSR